MQGSSNLTIGEAWRGQLLFALLTEADDLNDRLFKRQAIVELLKSKRLRREGMEQDGLLLQVEEFGGLRPRSRLWELVASLPVLEEREGRYFLRQEIPMSAFRSVGPRTQRSLLRIVWSLDEVERLFFPKPEIPWTVRTAMEAIQHGYGWLLWTAHFARDPANGLAGLPAFWQCHEEHDTSLGYQRAVTSIGDALGSLADSHYAMFSIAAVPGEHGPALASLVRWLLACRDEPNISGSWDATMRRWNQGGFFPFEDQPEAVYPTVDATWDAVLALTSVYDQFPDLDARYGFQGVERASVGAALLAGVEFLLRMQLPSGGWGIYRYPGDQPAVPPYEFTTAQTILALRLVLLASLFEDFGRAELRNEVETALRRAWGFLQSRRQEVEGRRLWLPYFSSDVQEYSRLDLLRAGAWTGTGLLAIYRGIPELREAIAPCLGDLLGLAEVHWEPDYRRIATVEFRVPLRERLNDSYGVWSNRLDVTLAVLLLDMSNEPDAPWPQPSASLWARLERTIGEILREQHPEHGHWGEPVEGMPLAAATAMAIQALQLYLTAAKRLLG